MSHAIGEIVRPAFPDRDIPKISFGLPFPEACAKHVEETFGASRVYIIASKSLSTNTDALKRLEEILGAANRASVLTSQLLAFSRRQVFNPIVVNVNHLLGNMGALLRREPVERAQLLLEQARGSVRAALLA